MSVVLGACGPGDLGFGTPHGQRGPLSSIVNSWVWDADETVEI